MKKILVKDSDSEVHVFKGERVNSYINSQGCTIFDHSSNTRVAHFTPLGYQWTKTEYANYQEQAGPIDFDEAPPHDDYPQQPPPDNINQDSFYQDDDDEFTRVIMQSKVQEEEEEEERPELDDVVDKFGIKKASDIETDAVDPLNTVT